MLLQHTKSLPLLCFYMIYSENLQCLTRGGCQSRGSVASRLQLFILHSNKCIDALSFKKKLIIQFLCVCHVFLCCHVIHSHGSHDSITPKNNQIWKINSADTVKQQELIDSITFITSYSNTKAINKQTSPAIELNAFFLPSKAQHNPYYKINIHFNKVVSNSSQKGQQKTNSAGHIRIFIFQ